jgi:heme/copper-type cytochrome/quinol oxidase subunit 3
MGPLRDAGLDDRQGPGLDWPPPAPPAAPGRDGGEGRESWPPVSNARLGMWMLLATETVFFGGLVGAFLVLRINAVAWPPPGQPRLPVIVTAANTLVLLASSFTLRRALAGVRHGDRTFYTVIGAHGLHVLAALVWLALVLGWAARGRYAARDHVGVAVCAMYWHFVVALWPILYVLVYLS